MTQATIGRKTFSVIEIDGTKYVCLPKEFVASHGIKKGDKIEGLFDGSIVYRTIKTKDIEQEITDTAKNLEAHASEGRYS